MGKRLFWGMAVFAAFIAVAAGARAESGSAAPAETAFAETGHAVRVDGKTLAYAASAGLLTVPDPATGKAGAEIFFVYYRKKDLREGEIRPLTFAFNGGPGAASMYLHLAALGPKTIRRSDDGTVLLPPPYGVVENPNTLLDLTDLVFIDPVGTGYSRALGDVDPRKFWGVREDLRSISDFIFQFLTVMDRLHSPVFIAGESYGGVRGAGLARVLQDAGIYPVGLVFISPALDLQNIQWSSMGDRAMVLSLPSYAAAAWYHKKIAPRLQGDLDKALEEVREWSASGLLPLFWKGDALSEGDRGEAAKRLSEYTGIDPRWILDRNLRIREREFAGQLLKGEGRSISVYDSRVTALGPYTGDDNDQGSFLLAGPLKTAMTAYLRDELGFRTDRRYLSGNAEVYLKWNWETGRAAPVNPDSINTGYPDISGDFAQAMNRCRFLKVFIGSGVFDLEVPYDSVLYTIRHLDVPPERRENVSMKLYPGGHMYYANPEAHRKFKEDLRAFYRRVLEELEIGTGAGKQGRSGGRP
ncbi:MAG TPA: hypothetical protein PLO86_07085 [Syntrophales bacterium]|nr:hypothetical protein [Syntrophales bacterium]HQB30512.1 hypothetical protein [Syntrophales bacterium]